jgi:FkbM family methyltransferase
VRRLIRGAARLLNRSRGYQPTRIGRERFRTDPDHIGFWRDVSRGRWEPAMFRFLEQSLGPGSVFADVGAWIGPTTLFASRRCRMVYCFEPDYEAYRYLLWNLELNARVNVVPFNAALGATTGMQRLWGAGDRLGTSRSSLLAAAEQPSVLVSSVSWNDWLGIARPGRIDCIKMDIEGGEFELLPAMRAHLAAERPALCLSLHAGRLPERERDSRLAQILDLLRVYPCWRNEAGQTVTPEAFAAVALAGDCVLLLSDR